MCEFISWKEMEDGSIRFLTYDQIYHTEQGKELQEFNPTESDWVGHGAIDFYYMLNRSEGIQRECTNFSTPDNFPWEIVEAIKTGEFRGLGIGKGLLNEEALAEYEKIKRSALAEYEKIKRSALAEYEKIRRSALAEYEKIEQSAWDEYKKIEQPAWDEHEKIRRSAPAEYEKIRQNTFWDLFADLENRNPLWV